MIFLRFHYLLLRGLSAIRYFLGTRVTPDGRLALAGLVAFAVFGIDTNRNVASQGFTLLLALFLFSRALLPRFRAFLELRRFLPRLATAGESFHYRLMVKNLGAFPLSGITLMSNLVTRGRHTLSIAAA